VEAFYAFFLAPRRAYASVAMCVVYDFAALVQVTFIFALQKIIFAEKKSDYIFSPLFHAQFFFIRDYE
jgi:hypothetical protein